jgi:ABC-type amino acid transport substrate-binding protein
VAAGQADAVVFDEPQLRHHLVQHPKTELVISDATYHPQGYGFALQPGDERVHDLNVALLTETEQGTVARARHIWLPDGTP